jgi:hypothetical protein
MSKGKQQGGALDIAAGALMAKFSIWALGKLGKGTRRLVFRWRRAISPVLFAGLVFLLAVVLRETVPWLWWTAAVLPVCGGLLAYFGPVLSERWSGLVTRLVPAGLDRGRDGVLDRPVERIYLAAMLTTIGTYLAVRWGFGPSEFTGWTWKIGLLVFGGSWWYHRRIRTAGRADRVAKRWTKFTRSDTCPANLKPLVGSKVLSATGEGRNSVLKVRVADAGTAANVERLGNPLAAYFKMRPGSVHIKGDMVDAGVAWFTFMPKDPWSGKIPHPMPEPGSISLKSTRGRFKMGELANGDDLIYQLQHTLAVGMNGSGKSIWLHALMAWLVACSDCLVVAIDMAGGATLTVWRKALSLPLATDLDSAMVVLNSVFAVIADRERQLGVASELDDDAADSFEPTRETPWMVLIIDEFPDLLAEAKTAGVEKQVITLLGRIAKKARKCGIRLFFASQNGTKVDLGSKELQAQLRAIVGLQLDVQQSKNLWGEQMRMGWNSTILQSGQFLLKDDEHTMPAIAKGLFVEMKERREQANKASELHKQLEPSANAALIGMAGSYLPPEIVVPAEPGDPILEYLATVDGTGARAADIVDLVPGVGSKATVFRRLGRLKEEGLAHSRGGVWHAGPDTRNPQDRADESAA